MSEARDRRQEARYEKEVDIIVFSGKHFFRTKTINLSDGGCRLQAPIPAHFTDDNLEVVFSGSEDGTHSFQMLRASVVDDSRTRLSLRGNFHTLSLV